MVEWEALLGFCSGSPGHKANPLSAECSRPVRTRLRRAGDRRKATSDNSKPRSESEQVIKLSGGYTSALKTSIKLLLNTDVRVQGVTSE